MSDIDSVVERDRRRSSAFAGESSLLRIGGEGSQRQGDGGRIARRNGESRARSINDVRGFSSRRL